MTCKHDNLVLIMIANDILDKNRQLFFCQGCNNNLIRESGDLYPVKVSHVIDNRYEIRYKHDNKLLPGTKSKEEMLGVKSDV